MIEQNILRLEIPIDDTVGVEAPECFDELSCIEASPPLAKLLIFAQVVEQLAAIEEIHDEVELGGRLERIVQFYDKWTVNLFEDVPLSLRLNKEVAFGDNGLGQLFHRVEIFRPIPSHEVDFTEGPSTNNLDQFEVIQANFLVRSE